MSRCFSVTTDEITSGSDYVTAKRRKNIYRTMQRSVQSQGNSAAAYLADNRNYRLKTTLQMPAPGSLGGHPCTSNSCLAQSQSYSDYLNMVRGRMYVNPKLAVPAGSKHHVSLSSMLQRHIGMNDLSILSPQVMTKALLLKPGFPDPTIWSLPYRPNCLGVPPEGETFDNFIYNGYPATVVDPNFQLYRGNCAKKNHSLKSRLYGVPCANANSYRYYQLAQAQPSSGVMFPSPVSFAYHKPGCPCAGCCDGGGSWGKGPPDCLPQYCASNPAPDQLEKVTDQKPCTTIC